MNLETKTTFNVILPGKKGIGGNLITWRGENAITLVFKRCRGSVLTNGMGEESS